MVSIASVRRLSAQLRVWVRCPPSGAKWPQEISQKVAGWVCGALLYPETDVSKHLAELLAHRQAINAPSPVFLLTPKLSSNQMDWKFWPIRLLLAVAARDASRQAILAGHLGMSAADLQKACATVWNRTGSMPPGCWNYAFIWDHLATALDYLFPDVPPQFEIKNRMYLVPGCQPVKLSRQQESLLVTLQMSLGKSVPLDALREAGVGDPPNVLLDLRNKLKKRKVPPPTISPAGGGYLLENN